MKVLAAAFMMALLFSAIVATAYFGAVQAATMWTQTYGAADLDHGYSVVETSDGGYAIAGNTYSFGAGGGDVWLVKTDAAGVVQWNQTYGGTALDCGYSVVETSDGGYAIAGDTQSFGAGGNDVWLVKTDATGNMEWNQTYGGTKGDGANSLVQTSDGGYALAGHTYSYGAGSGDFWLVKTDSSGNELWNQTYGGADTDSGRSLVETSDGGFAIAYQTSNFVTGIADVWLVKTDEYGVVPEAAWVVLPLLVIATLAILMSKKKLLHKQNRRILWYKKSG